MVLVSFMVVPVNGRPRIRARPFSQACRPHQHGSVRPRRGHAGECAAQVNPEHDRPAFGLDRLRQGDQAPGRPPPTCTGHADHVQQRQEDGRQLGGQVIGHRHRPAAVAVAAGLDHLQQQCAPIDRTRQGEP
jgi:hypothetical protein